MQSKTDKVFDDLAKNIDIEELFQKIFKEVNVWNWQLSEKTRKKLIKEGTLF